MKQKFKPEKDGLLGRELSVKSRKRERDRPINSALPEVNTGVRDQPRLLSALDQWPQSDSLSQRQREGPGGVPQQLRVSALLQRTGSLISSTHIR